MFEKSVISLTVLEFADRVAGQADTELVECLAVDFTEHHGRMDLGSFEFRKLVQGHLAVLIKKAAKIQKASGEPNKNKVAKITKEQCAKIAETKMKDLNAANIDTATSMIMGTARSMGIEVVD